MATRPISGRMDDWNYIVSVGPDVCWTPMGSSKVKVAYDSFVDFSDCARTSKSVFNNQCEDVQVNTRPFGIKGHEPGTLKGAVVAGYQQYATIRKGSSTVFSEGWQVVRDGDPAWINRPDTASVESKSSLKKEKLNSYFVKGE